MREIINIVEALSYEELNNDEAHQLQLRTAYKDAMRLFNTVTISKFNWKLGKAKIIVERRHHKQGAQRLFIVNEDKECLGSINITTIDNHDLRVNFSIVFEEYRNMNLAYYAYKSLLDSGYAISSDIHLSKAAVSLWKKLWNDPSLVHGVYEFQFNAPPLYIGSDDFDSVFEDRSRFIKVEKR